MSGWAAMCKSDDVSKVAERERVEPRVYELNSTAHLGGHLMICCQNAHQTGKRR